MTTPVVPPMAYPADMRRFAAQTSIFASGMLTVDICDCFLVLKGGPEDDPEPPAGGWNMDASSK